MKINIYTWKEYLQKENRSEWFPLLFELLHLNNKKLLNHYELVNSLEDADIFILPLDIGWYFRNRKEDRFFEVLDKVKAKQKNIWIYSAGDYGKSLEHSNLYTFRLGGFHSKLNEITFILPSFINDPMELFDFDFDKIKKTPKPKLGFVGRANNSFYSYVYDIGIFIMLYLRRIRGNNYVDHQPFFSSSRNRFEILENLKKNPMFRTDFLYRKKYRAGAKSPEDRRKVKKEFYMNIRQNHFTICYRGQGNFSVRLYETLAMGRIPILIDSDFRLPLPWLDWQGHIVECTRENTPHKLLEFYDVISEENFGVLQQKNRLFWQEKLTRTGFFTEIKAYFENEV